MSIRREFRLRHVDAGIHVELNNALDATVHCMSVEYLRRPLAVKPHVVFNFNCINPLELLTTHTQQSKGCRVSMEWTGRGDTGGLKIIPRSYMESSHLAIGALSFSLINQSFTLREVIDIFRGRHPLNTYMAASRGADQLSQPRHLADLTRFDFVQADPNNQALDGCRDFMYVLPTSTYINIYRVLTGLVDVKHSPACAILALSAASVMASPRGEFMRLSIKRFPELFFPTTQLPTLHSTMSSTRTFCL